VPHRAETRSAGRHRHESRSRHRAPRTGLRRGAITVERHRTALLTASLGAALVAGVAGGTAAAAATNRHTAAATRVVTAADHAPAADQAPRGFAPAKTQPRSFPGPHDPADLAGLAAVPARQPGTVPAQQPGTVPAQQPGTVPAQQLAAVPAWQFAAVPARQKARPKPAAKAAKSPGAAWVHPNPSGAVTSCFGPRWGRHHAGVDLAAPAGTAIVAAGAGVVLRAGAAGGYGNAVLIDHGNGYLTHYGHLAAITVGPGQRVAAGERIGDEGSTGHSTGPHLHFEVHQGHFQNPVEPTGWMREHGVDIDGCAPTTD
jgi:murein DD-endopeptidase MepM/ murein hydrolase activator NlpD